MSREITNAENKVRASFLGPNSSGNPPQMERPQTKCNTPNPTPNPTLVKGRVAHLHHNAIHREVLCVEQTSPNRQSVPQKRPSRRPEPSKQQEDGRRRGSYQSGNNVNDSRLPATMMLLSDSPFIRELLAASGQQEEEDRCSSPSSTSIFPSPPPPDVVEAVRSAVRAEQQQQGDAGGAAQRLRDEALLATSRWTNDLFRRQMRRPTSDAAYTEATLQFYDLAVWHFNSPFHWLVRAEQVQHLYDDCLSSSEKHAEVAVGTGLFLRNLRGLSAVPSDDDDDDDDKKGAGDSSNRRRLPLKHLTLLDLNPNTTNACRSYLREIAFYRENVVIESAKYDVLHDDGDGDKDDRTNPKLRPGTYDSVAANFLVHCLHGGIDTTRKAFGNIRRLLKPLASTGAAAADDDGGVFFGTTILGAELESDEDAPPAALETNRLYNEIGIFGNRDDTFESVLVALEENFDQVDVWRVGYCAAWKARKPKGTK